MVGVKKGHVYRRVPCKVCKVEVAVNQMAVHLRAKHGEQKSGIDVCPECGETITHHNLRRHLKRIHGIVPEPSGLSTLRALVDGKPPKEPRPAANEDGMIPCPVCGRACAPKGYPNHLASHARSKAVATVPLPKVSNGTHHATVNHVQELTGVPNALDGVTSMEVALAVLSRLSTTGTIKIVDLPEVMGWVAATDHIIRVVSQP
jgi:hypothetical protein